MLIELKFGNCMKTDKNRLIRGSSGYRLFFIRPRKSSNADLVAQKLLKMNNAKEVLLTEGPFGFVVKAAGADDRDDLDEFMEKNFKYRKVVCRYRYGKID